MRRRSPWGRAGAALAGSALLLAATTGGAASTSGSWTVYHGDPAGTGVDASGATFSSPVARWTSPALDRQLYGEPLVTGTTVVVATENDTVDALSTVDGHLLWSRHLATPVPSGDLPCGDITPTVGITGTPVVDPAHGEVFVVADELVNGSPAHVLVGLDLATGAVRTTVAVDPQGSTPAALLQRTGLALDGDDVVFGFGGNYGDCGDYHGWVVSVPEAGGAPVDYDVTPGSGQGAVWQGGAAPEVDASGDVWVATGNGRSTDPSAFDGGDSVVELSPSLQRLAYFAPADWASQNANDLDLGSSPPALLADGLVLQAGKSHTAYLLKAAALGGVGGQVAELGSVCSQDVDGGLAWQGDLVYLPCQSGLVALRVTAAPTPSVTLAWHNAVGGDPPILAGGLVWSTDAGGTLYGLDPATGAVVEHLDVGAAANHFPTPSVGDGLLLVTSADQVHAFADAAPAATTTSAPTTTVATTPPTTTVPATTTTSPAASAGGWPVGATVGVAVAGAAGLGALAWWLVRRRRARRP